MHEEFELAAVVQAVEIAVQEQEAAAMREAERFRRLEEARVDAPAWVLYRLGRAGAWVVRG